MSVLFNSFIIASLFNQSATQQERLKILKPMFSPPVGHTVRIKRSSKVKFSANHLRTKGFIQVNPPQDQCLTITTDPEKPDHRICKSTSIAFELKDIDASGKLSWRVSAGPQDNGTAVSWNTPYRLANVVPLGELDAGMNQNIGIYACKASESTAGRKVELELFTGDKWYVMFPKNDSLVKPHKKTPNLYVRIMTQSKDGKSSTENLSSGESGMPTITQEDIKRKHKLLSLKLSGKYKEAKKKEYEFIIPPWEAYEMNAARFTASGTPLKLNGKCRYKYSDAPRDKNSGAIECYNTDEFDAIYLHMTCSSVFRPRKKPNEK